MEQRLLLALLLSGVVFFTSQYFIKPPVPSKPIQQTKPVAPQQESVRPPAPTPPTGERSTPVAASKEESFTVETSVFRVVFSNHGAVVRSWLLKNYKDEAGKPLEVVDAAVAPQVYFPFAISFKSQKSSADVNQVFFATKPAPGGLGVDFEYSDGRTTARKSFRFDANSYLVQVVSEVTENNVPLAHLLVWRGGFGDKTVISPGSVQHALYYDQSANKLVANEAKAAKDGPVTVAGNFAFAGLEDAFFAAVFLPKSGRSVEMQTLADDLPSAADPNKKELRVGAGVGGDGRNELSLFLGPKDVDLLGRFDSRLTTIVDFGRLAIIAKPLFLAVHWVNDQFVHNYGWSIVVVTILINIIVLPLRLSGMKSMRRMQAIKPQVDEINERYKNIKITDPRKAQQNEETMALHKRHNVNPLGGCIPMVIPIPFLIAFYTVLSVSIEMRGAHWLWVTDLSQPEKLPVHLLPIILVLTQYVVQTITPNPSIDPSQQNVMKLMPLMYAFLFYNARSGLVIYWLTGNLVGIVQQWIFNRVSPMPPAAAVVTTPKKRAPKR